MTSGTSRPEAPAPLERPEPGAPREPVARLEPIASLEPTAPVDQAAPAKPAAPLDQAARMEPVARPEPAARRAASTPSRRTVRIGAGLGFYGDLPFAAAEAVRAGDIQYLCCDHLAELTMAILHKDRQRDPRTGYTRDIGLLCQMVLPVAMARGVRLISNAGGLNPYGAAREVLQVAARLGLRDLKVAVVTGDDVLGRLDAFRQQGAALEPLDGGPSYDEVRHRLLFANAYLGAEPVVRALATGAHVVITGRVADASLFLAPLVYEFGWGWDDWDRLATGVVAGHIGECSAQATGGNFSGRWWEVPDMDRIGYPVAEVDEDGGLVITKPAGTGGLVTPDTVKEQLYYEVHDPAHYVNPDVVADFSQIELHPVGPDRVAVTGTRGRPRPETLKVTAGYEDGWLGQAIIGYSWPDALEKAQAAEQIIRRQMARAGLNPQEVHVEYLGVNALHGPLAPIPDEPNEVYLRFVIRTQSREEAERLSRLFPPLALNGPPYIGGALAGLSRSRQLLGIWSTAVPRAWVEQAVRVEVLGVDDLQGLEQAGLGQQAGS
ncbi:MAG TPA: acyclic terpene utilization AtuA family protein [Thermaerobacter sp.]